MRLCVAQIRSVAGDVLTNLAIHRRAVSQAHSLRADLLLFPELSLTGYEPSLAHDLATTAEDRRFDVLQAESDCTGMIIGAGWPLATDAGIEIGMILFQRNQPRQTCSKQILHPDEQPFFVPGRRPVLIQALSHTLAPAICFESLQPQHAASAAQRGADVYLASVAKSGDGVTKAGAHYPHIARVHAMTVIMANCLGPCDNFTGAGQSAIWNSSGEVVGQLDDRQEGVLLFDTITQDVASAV
jgi:predicted amidohydrolase